QSGLNVLGISTAFEDFEYNTAANTELLLTEMKLVGATWQALGEFYSQAIHFPVAVDQLTTDTRTLAKVFYGIIKGLAICD
ncbi:hypothetical protein H6G97_49565, partial [Nostoc flagelliforme FACHB-838]